jgi:hypothetical protein
VISTVPSTQQVVNKYQPCCSAITLLEALNHKLSFSSPATPESFLTFNTYDQVFFFEGSLRDTTWLWIIDSFLYSSFLYTDIYLILTLLSMCQMQCLIGGEQS